MTWLRQAWTGDAASDITDKGDVLRLTASGYIELTSLYVHMISIAVPWVKGMERAEPKAISMWLGYFVKEIIFFLKKTTGVAYPQGFAETLMSQNTSVLALAGASYPLSEQALE